MNSAEFGERERPSVFRCHLLHEQSIEFFHPDMSITVHSMAITFDWDEHHRSNKRRSIAVDAGGARQEAKGSSPRRTFTH